MKVAAERQYRGIEGIEGAIPGVRAAPAVHVRLAVPEAGWLLVSQILLDRLAAVLPHPGAVLVAEENRSLQKILVVGVDPAHDSGGRIGPFPGFHVNLRSHEPNRGASLVQFHNRALGLVVVLLLAGVA